MSNQCDAKLVGVPTGGLHLGYGEVREFNLPHSGWGVVYSTRGPEPGKSQGLRLVPDISIPLTFHEFAAGVDPVLDWLNSEGTR